MIVIEKNKRSLKQICDFLIAADNLFPIPLHKKVDIKSYARKLFHNSTILSITKNNKIIAMVCGYINPNSLSYASLLAVLPKYQGNAYGERLMREFVNIAKSKKSSLVHLYTTANNTKAISLYKKMGFTKYCIKNDKRQRDLHLCYNLENNFLVTSIGSYSADIVIKKLKTIDDSVIIGTDIYDKRMVVDAHNVDYFYQIAKVADEKKFTNDIKRIIKKHNIKYIIPLTDVDVDYFCKKRDSFNNVEVFISPNETISICRNKLKMKEFIDNNVNFIKTIPTYNSISIKNNMKLPLIAKLIDGRSSQGLVKINNLKEFEYFIKNNTRINKYIFQPVVCGHVVTVDVVCDGQKCVSIAREELLRTYNGAGLSVRVFHDRKLENNCKKLALALGIRGCVNFEFIKNSKNEYQFVECNPRFSAGLEFSCIAGYDCILNHIKCFKGGNIDEFKNNKVLYIARKYEEYITEDQ